MTGTEALRIESLSVDLGRGRSGRPILSDVSMYVRPGETVGFVGESGSGKSVTTRTVLAMLPAKASVSGRVLVDGVDVLSADRRRLRSIRSGQVAMIFQDPRAGINPVRRIREYLAEGLVASGGRRADALARCSALLESVGIRDPAKVLEQFPHQLSGGMLQRIMIAGALASEPALLLADEPTTALDVTTQAEVVSILERRRADAGAAMLFVTHDLDLAAAICERIYVMYAGRIVEHQSAADLFANPRHPYTRALLASTPRLGESRRIEAIPGRPLSLSETVAGCGFAPRCAFAGDLCTREVPALRRIGGAEVACLRAEEVAPS
ncbi:ABC transporter ATP-binding protein [Sphaerisporangium sp. NPDC051017]|uniref:ABC transporter ATP-binding protein n=1 Tax=unclassified Sphaerisporangium TaxID=2630420 RepID=UPI0033C6F2CA